MKANRRKLTEHEIGAELLALWIEYFEAHQMARKALSAAAEYKKRLSR